MTTEQMVDNFLLEYDINGSGAVAGFTYNEILSFLNKAQFQIAEDVFLKIGPDQIYDINSIDEMYLAATIVTDTDYYNALEFQDSLPDDYMYYITSSIYMSRNTIKIMSNGWVPCQHIATASSEKFITSDVNIPIFVQPVVFLRDGNMTILIDSYTTIFGDGSDINFILKYAKIPATIDKSVNCELSEKWHQDIVNAAVVNALQVTGDYRIRTQQNKE